MCPPSFREKYAGVTEADLDAEAQRKAEIVSALREGTEKKHQMRVGNFQIQVRQLSEHIRNWIKDFPVVGIKVTGKLLKEPYGENEPFMIDFFEVTVEHKTMVFAPKALYIRTGWGGVEVFIPSISDKPLWMLVMDQREAEGIAIRAGGYADLEKDDWKRTPNTQFGEEQFFALMDQMTR